MARPKGSADAIADRRRRALSLLDQNLSLNEVARRIGCQPCSVMRWREMRRRRGQRVFEVRFSPGRPVKLARDQRRRLIKLLLKGSMAHGYRTELWTCARIAEMIRKEFGVNYHRDHIGRLMRALGWSSQKPQTRAVERDEAQIDAWKRRRWPRVKKTPRGWAPISSS
jgi:transposase